MDGDASIVDMNPSAESLLGISCERAIGETLPRLLPTESNELGRMLDAAFGDQHSFAQDLSIAERPEHADEQVLDCRVSPVVFGNERYVLAEFADITRRVRLHRDHALLQQHGASRRMVRQLAHEIKNPLGGIRGSAQLLARKLQSADLDRYTDVIIHEADRLAALADTLLGPGASGIRRATNLHDLLEHVARLVESDDDTAVTVVREYDLGLPTFKLDRDQFVQALLNLATNAAQATGDGGRLVFRTSAISNYTIGDTCHRVIASIDIEDDGPGVATDIVESLFFPLVTGRDGGTGLGLPIAQELVSRHGGLIEFESRPGRTVFQIRLPIGPDD